MREPTIEDRERMERLRVAAKSFLSVEAEFWPEHPEALSEPLEALDNALEKLLGDADPLLARSSSERWLLCWRYPDGATLNEVVPMTPGEALRVRQGSDAQYAPCLIFAHELTLEEYIALDPESNQEPDEPTT